MGSAPAEHTSDSGSSAFANTPLSLNSNLNSNLFNLNNSQQNAPPRIFGNYNPDGSLIQPGALNYDYFGDGDFLVDDAADTADAKRRRIAKACDACRRKKIRCDGKTPRCSHCENYKTECVFTHVEKKRQPPKGAKYIQGLENRLGRMEHLLRLSGLLTDEDSGNADLKTLEERLARQKTPQLSPNSHLSEPTSQSAPPAGSSGNHSNGATPRSVDVASPETQDSPFEMVEDPVRRKLNKLRDRDVETLSDMMCSLVTSKTGETKFIGSSSGFSIFSPRGIQWINEKTGDESFKDLMQTIANEDSSKWFKWRPEGYEERFQRGLMTPLPPKEESLALIKEYFESFNNLFPLFHEPTFRLLVEKQYSNDPERGSGWWASLNVVLAIAYRVRVVKNLSLGDEDAKAWAYIRNALATHSELTIKNNDLVSVQALIGMSFFMHGTPNPQPTFSLTGSAVRLMHSIGLHKRSSGFGLNKAEVEQRKRVFWLAYMTDKDQCLRSGRPPLQSDDDWNVELPDEDPEDGVGVVSASNGDKVNLFRKFCEFSIISSRVYTELYSVRASKQSDGQLLNTIGDLDTELQNWKDSIPVDFRPEHEPNTASEHLLLQVVTVHFAYYNCLTTIHRMAIHHGVWTSRLSDYAISGQNIKPLNPRVYSSAALCVQAARASINLIKYIPQGDFSCVWMILYYPTSALVTLFANILQNPTDARAKADLKLMSVVVNFLSRICIEEETGSTRHMYIVCKEFERIAKLVLQRAEKEMTSRQKRKQTQEQDKINESEVDPGLDGRPGAPAASLKQGAATTGRETWPANGTSPGDVRFGAPDGINGLSAEELWASAQSAVQGDGNVLLPNTQGSNGGGAGSGFTAGAFQQPFLPQEMWSMPMTFEWDFADMATGSTPFDQNVGFVGGTDGVSGSANGGWPPSGS